MCADFLSPAESGLTIPLTTASPRLKAGGYGSYAGYADGMAAHLRSRLTSPHHIAKLLRQGGREHQMLPCRRVVEAEEFGVEA